MQHATKQRAKMNVTIRLHLRFPPAHGYYRAVTTPACQVDTANGNSLMTNETS
jgi:hypothetical protein